MKVLLAVDGSDYSLVAVESVAGRPWPKNTEVKVITAMEPLFLPTTDTWALPDSYYQELEASAEEKARGAIKAALERIEASEMADVKLSSEIKEGQPADVIIGEAEAWNADLIILGSHGYKGWQRLLLGSVSHAVATHAPCSVEIVRQKQEAAK